MVQYTPAFGMKTEEDYWKIQDFTRVVSKQSLKDFLDKYGYAHNDRTATKLQLSDFCVRAERGMMSYEDRTQAELRKFCKQRGLPDSRMSRYIHIRRLHDADNHATFPKFMVLPPELRLRVYEFAMISVGVHSCATKELLKPNPLTQTSQLLRKESLPIFLQLRGVAIRVGCVPESYPRSMITEPSFDDIMSKTLYDDASDTTLAKIKCVRFFGYAAPWSPFKFIYKIEVNDDKRMRINHHTTAEFRTASQAERAAIVKLNSQMKEVAKEIKERGLSREILKKVNELFYHAFD